jgi:glutaredoxin
MFMVWLIVLLAKYALQAENRSVPEVFLNSKEVNDIKSL